MKDIFESTPLVNEQVNPLYTQEESIPEGKKLYLLK